MNSYFSKKQKAKGKKQKIISLFAIYYLIFTISSMPIYALELDTSVDDYIRKNYNPNKIEEDMQLPALPKILNEKDSGDIVPINSKPNLTPIKKPEVVERPAIKAQIQPKTQVETAPQPQIQKQVQIQKQAEAKTQLPSREYTQEEQETIKQYSPERFATLKFGTKIRVRGLNAVSDKTRKNTVLTFVTTRSVTTTYLTLPTGTVLKGEVVESHRPGLTANGGLIKIRIFAIILNGHSQQIEGCITRANTKKIFLNNIKGKRQYMSSMIKSTKNGRHFFKKMLRVTAYLASDGSSIIIAPFSLIAGVLGVAANVLSAPVLAVFYKGGSISINEGSDFEIKLLQDVYIYK